MRNGSRRALTDTEQQMLELLPGMIEKWEGVIGLSASRIRIKRMRSRWGSCNPRTRKITLNLELAKKPAHCLEYVIVHELVHLVERSHNQNFKSLMSHYLPRWKVIRKELNRSAMAQGGRNE